MNTPIVKEVTIDAPVSAVWSAIADKDKMKQWYFDIAEFEPIVGFKFSFIGVDESKCVEYVHLCQVTEVILNKKLAYTWQYDGYEGISHVTFELFDENGKTRVKLTHEGIENFPALEAFARESFTGGWNYIIGTSLKEFAEKNS